MLAKSLELLGGNEQEIAALCSQADCMLGAGGGASGAACAGVGSGVVRLLPSGHAVGGAAVAGLGG